MAPTEILASQHYSNIARLLAPSRFRVDMLTGSTPGLHKHTLLSHIERGTTHLDRYADVRDCWRTGQ